MTSPQSKPEAKEVTRHIKEKVKTALWGRAAGRCQFSGCNRPLYCSPITFEPVNIAEVAHIYSFSKEGPRGWGPFITNKKALNEIDNLLLACHDCHKTIDQDELGESYNAELLRLWKREHEERIWIVGGIEPDKKSHVVLFGANIGKQQSPLNKIDAVTAMFPNRYPVEPEPVTLSMQHRLDDGGTGYWAAELENLNTNYELQVQPRLSHNDPAHFSVFALAPIPLLIRLGTLLTDKLDVDVYQPIREPKGWAWPEQGYDFEFEVRKPKFVKGPPVLILALSAEIENGRVESVAGEDISLWEVRTPEGFQHNDFMRSKSQLERFRKTMRAVLANILAAHGQDIDLAIFPAMPVSCAIELGRVRMPKATLPWAIYDQNYELGKFVHAITI